MHCRFCGYTNPEGESRCVRCDGRLHPPVVSGRSSAVPATQDDTQPVPAIPREPLPREGQTVSAPPRQAALFDRGNVIAFPAQARRGRTAQATQPVPRVQQGEAQPPRTERPASRANTTQTLSNTTLSATQERLMGIEIQQRLDLLPHDAEAPKQCRSDAPVAAPSRRVKAALVDAVVVFAGVAVSLAPFLLLGGEFVLTSKTLAGFGAYAATLALFYQVMWCVLRRESFGMSSQRMRLVNFDGEAPRASRRWARLGAVLLGSLAAGLGLLWALMDQERLAWHDHISKTYPTGDNPHAGTFHRR